MRFQHERLNAWKNKPTGKVCIAIGAGMVQFASKNAWTHPQKIQGFQLPYIIHTRYPWWKITHGHRSSSDQYNPRTSQIWITLFSLHRRGVHTICFILWEINNTQAQIIPPSEWGKYTNEADQAPHIKCKVAYPKLRYRSRTVKSIDMSTMHERNEDFSLPLIFHTRSETVQKW